MQKKYFSTSQAFFNEDALKLIRTLITGGATQELEQILAEGVGLVQGETGTSLNISRDRCRVALIPLEDGVLDHFSVSYNKIRIYYNNNYLAAMIRI